MARQFSFFTAVVVFVTIQQPAFADLTWLACSWDNKVDFKVGVGPSSSSISYIGPSPKSKGLSAEKLDYQYDVKGLFSPDNIQFELSDGDKFGMYKNIYSINRTTLRWNRQQQFSIPFSNIQEGATSDTVNYGGQRICKKIILQGNKI